MTTCNEINPTTNDWLCYEGKVFELAPSDISSLKEKGVCRAYYVGELVDYIDLDELEDLEFAKWYFGAKKIKNNYKQ